MGSVRLILFQLLLQYFFSKQIYQIYRAKVLCVDLYGRIVCSWG
jgi:hypothetical protein